MPNRFRDLLNAMDMGPDPDECPGLVKADLETLEAKRHLGAALEEIIALERALHFKAGYVYFRRTPERPPVPTAYLYDWTTLGEAQRAASNAGKALPQSLRNDLRDLHRQLWSAGEVPLVFVFLATEVQVYHVLKGPDKTENEIEASPWRIIKVAGDVADALQGLKALSARRFDDGRFWEEDLDARKLKLDGCAFMALLIELGRCKATLEDQKINPILVKRLLILFIMIKYLEERRDHRGQGVFPDSTFAQFAPGATCFIDLLRAGGKCVVDFLDQLASKERFNGEVFALDQQEREALLKTSLEPFADLLDARSDGVQYTFWRRYAFNELPVELISHLYEQFLPRQPGVVYTPPVLVNFILDEVLPLSEKTPDTFRLLDPACGSGVFLVGAFRRLVQRWRRDHSFNDPDVDTLKALLRNHLFGVDLEGDAVRITLFSLSVALCDFLEPRVIWNDLHFNNLKGTNLFESDFFLPLIIDQWQGENGFELIVGNPPFESKLSSAAQAELKRIKRIEPDFELPDRQLALLFLKSATRITKPGGQVALILPTGPLLYNDNSARFRQPFFKQKHISHIVDFTHLSRVLFKRPKVGGTAKTKNARSSHPEKVAIPAIERPLALDAREAQNGGSSNPGDVAVGVIFAENRPPTGEPLLHVTVRRTLQADQKLMFEIDHYDLHFVPRLEAQNNPRIWKANFVGGGRISFLLRRIAPIQTLGAFLITKKKKRHNRWTFGTGYIVGNASRIQRLHSLKIKELEHGLPIEEAKELARLAICYKTASWLTGHEMVPTRDFTARGIDWKTVTKIEEEYFDTRCHADLFSGPVLIIKEGVEPNTEKIPVELVEEGIRFKDRIFGIHAPATEVAELKRIQSTISDLRRVRFHLLATSGEYLINRSAAIHSADLLKLPFPEPPNELHFSPLDEALIDDVVDYVAEFKRKGPTADVLKPPNQKQLLQFGDFFCQVLGSVYKSLRAAAPVHLDGGICYPFYFGELPADWLEPGPEIVPKLEALLSTKVGASLSCRRILRIFHGNMILLVKPPQLRYWLRSIAIRDADEIFGELQGKGY